MTVGFIQWLTNQGKLKMCFQVPDSRFQIRFPDDNNNHTHQQQHVLPSSGSRVPAACVAQPAGATGGHPHHPGACVGWSFPGSDLGVDVIPTRRRGAVGAAYHSIKVCGCVGCTSYTGTVHVHTGVDCWWVGYI